MNAGKCFDTNSFECTDFCGLSQIIANLTRESLADLEAEIRNLPWTDRERQSAGQMQTWTPCLACQETYALSPPDNIRWVIDRTEFDELIAVEKDSAPGTVPEHFAESRTVFIPKKSMTME